MVKVVLQNTEIYNFSFLYFAFVFTYINAKSPNCFHLNCMSSGDSVAEEENSDMMSRATSSLRNCKAKENFCSGSLATSNASSRYLFFKKVCFDVKNGKK